MSASARALFSTPAHPAYVSESPHRYTLNDIEAFFSCLAGNCCASCESADFNNDGDVATDRDIESFFRVLAGGAC